MIIVLLGYMGCGKSTVGQRLAEKLEFNFLDLDEFVEQKQQATISELFDSKGELFFRNIEAQAVKQLCNESDSLILALGGGTPCYADTMQFLVNHLNVKTVYLNLSIKNLSDRLIHEKAKRPLIANLNKEDIPEFIGKHLFERAFFYNQAELTIHTDNLAIEEILAQIQTELL